MNIQIFGSLKSRDTKKAQRYFKERSIVFQNIDIREKGISRGELASVSKALGGYENLLDSKCRDQDTFTLIKYLSEEDRPGKILENQQVLCLPIVRNGNLATVGYHPEIWKNWK